MDKFLREFNFSSLPHPSSLGTSLTDIAEQCCSTQPWQVFICPPEVLTSWSNSLVSYQPPAIPTSPYPDSFAINRHLRLGLSVPGSSGCHHPTQARAESTPPLQGYFGHSNRLLHYRICCGGIFHPICPAGVWNSRNAFRPPLSCSAMVSASIVGLQFERIQIKDRCKYTSQAYKKRVWSKDKKDIQHQGFASHHRPNY